MVTVVGSVGVLDGVLLHRPRQSLFEYVHKRNLYSEHRARHLHAGGERFRLHRLLLRPAAAFVRSYGRHGGWRDGVPGLDHRLERGLRTFLQDAKLWQLEEADGVRAAGAPVSGEIPRATTTRSFVCRRSRDDRDAVRSTAGPCRALLLAQLHTTRGRWSSYWHQIRLVLERGADACLVVGNGDGIVPSLLERAGVRTTTVDIDPRLDPDTIADVGWLQFPDRSFDCVLAAQILEHVRFETLDGALSEMRRVTRSSVVASVPQRGRAWELAFKGALPEGIQGGWRPARADEASLGRPRSAGSSARATSAGHGSRQRWRGISPSPRHSSCQITPTTASTSWADEQHRGGSRRARELVKDIGSTVGMRFAALPISFVASIVLARSLQPSGKGAYTTVMHRSVQLAVVVGGLRSLDRQCVLPRS